MKRNIAIIEDDRDLREAMSLMIQFTDNYELVCTFQNAEEALEKADEVEVDEYDRRSLILVVGFIGNVC